MRLTRNIIILLAQIAAANYASAQSLNPCADAVAEHCSGIEGDKKAMHYCLARVRNRVEMDCKERVETFYRQNPDEVMPETEDEENERKSASGSVQPNYGVPWWPEPNSPSKKIDRKKMEKTPSIYDSPASPTENIYDPYYNLRNMIQGGGPGD